MRSTVFTMPAVLLLFLCLGCNNAKYSPAAKEATPTNSGVMDSSAVATDNKFEEPSPRDQSPGQKNQQPTPPPVINPDWDKKIIRTADLNVEVKSFRTFADRLRQNVKRAGGYIAQEQQTQSLSTIENTVTIKVPVDRFEDLLGDMTSDSDRLVEKKISSELGWIIVRRRLSNFPRKTSPPAARG